MALKSIKTSMLELNSLQSNDDSNSFANKSFTNGSNSYRNALDPQSSSKYRLNVSLNPKPILGSNSERQQSGIAQEPHIQYNYSAQNSPASIDQNENTNGGSRAGRGHNHDSNQMMNSFICAGTFFPFTMPVVQRRHQRNPTEGSISSIGGKFLLPLYRSLSLYLLSCMRLCTKLVSNSL